MYVLIVCDFTGRLEGTVLNAALDGMGMGVGIVAHTVVNT